ncbi:uncharacterized protein METZ01_LOCUS461988, partial [marine metagenome]
MTEVSDSTAPVEITQPRRYRLVIAGLVILAHFSVGLNVFSISPLLGDVISDHGVNRSAAGLLIALTMLVFAGF